MEILLKLNMHATSVKTHIKYFLSSGELGSDEKLLADFPTKVQVAENLKYIIWI